mmetsp:Transcript_9512/g.14279  ORF Transcript_9512/g.14279 Transcript_9512/m.14279 type:complete len:335 (-) Transcript_9512:201-1205(-)
MEKVIRRYAHTCRDLRTAVAHTKSAIGLLHSCDKKDSKSESKRKDVLTLRGFERELKPETSGKYVQLLEKLSVEDMKELIDDEISGIVKQAYWHVALDCIRHAQAELQQMKDDLKWLREVQEVRRALATIREYMSHIEGEIEEIGDFGLLSIPFDSKPGAWVENLIQLDLKEMEASGIVYSRLARVLSEQRQMLTGDKDRRRRETKRRLKTAAEKARREGKSKSQKLKKNDAFLERMSKPKVRVNKDISSGGYAAMWKASMRSGVKVSKKKKFSPNSSRSHKKKYATFSPRLSKNTNRMMQGRESFWERLDSDLKSHKEKVTMKKRGTNPLGEF